MTRQSFSLFDGCPCAVMALALFVAAAAGEFALYAAT